MKLLEDKRFYNYFIYKTTNLINNKIYIGKRKIANNVKRNNKYLGSGKILINAINKYGKENFKREILEYCFKDQVKDKETYWIDKLGSRDHKIGYNIAKGGDGGDTMSHHPNKEEIYKKIKVKRGKVIHIYNNMLDIEKIININDVIPNGFIRGVRPKGKNKYFFVYNKELDICLKINKNDIIPDGFIRGTGRYKSDETKHKMSISKIGDKNSSFKYVYWCEDIKTNEKIEIENIRSFCRKNEYNFTKIKNRVNRNIEIYGFCWFRKEIIK